MKVRVYAPPFADPRAIDEDGCVDLPEGARLGALFKALRLPFKRGLVLLCVVNYERAGLSRVLRDGDRVSFISPLAGG